jgi:hypothetical protein
MYVPLVWGYLNGIAVDSLATYDDGLQCQSAQRSVLHSINTTGGIVKSMVCVHTDRVEGSFCEADTNGTLQPVPNK